MFIVVTGGSGSGKSEFAERRVLELGDGERIYIATMMCFDEESKKRVARHRKMRQGKGFRTVERYFNLKDLDLSDPKMTGKEGKRTVLLECMSNLAANEMFDPNGAKASAAEEIKIGIDRLLGKCDNLVVVTNEVFSDGLTYDAETVKYQQLLGTVNRYMASLADEVTEVVYGIPVPLKCGKEENGTAAAERESV
ncbi:MAG: bifunctional adenosylcobinamide kinase/adenosylcobinamide-phosphate guanylyltransferase [Lachnospiraceae bacterium]|nr:bifunctional adenosylcobinamide kinase/adenosylcobinamide-phosphate guanylyltransferase [Lachnospiraceae bacterium]